MSECLGEDCEGLLDTHLNVHQHHHGDGDITTANFLQGQGCFFIYLLFLQAAALLLGCVCVC